MLAVKKTVSVCLIFLLFALIPLSVLATAEPTFSVGTVSAKPGETVSVPVTIQNNSGIVALKINIAYDANVLSLQSVTDAALFPGGSLVVGGNVQANPYTVLWEDSLSRENYTQNGTFVTLKFVVSETAKSGDTAVTVSYDAGSTFDTDLNEVSFSTRNGKVQITSESEPPTLAVPEGATTVIDTDRKFIYGLKLMITESELLNDYLCVSGNGRLEIATDNGFIGTGTKVHLVDNATDETVDTYTIVLFGDIDGDGLISNQDIAELKNRNAQVASYSMDEASAFACDLMVDDMITNQDVSIIKNLFAGIITIDQVTREQNAA